MPNGPGETLLTGDAATKAKDAALAAVPGATVIRVETDSGDAEYEAHLKKADGTEVTVLMDANFTVTSTVDGFGGGPGGPGGPGMRARRSRGSPNGSSRQLEQHVSGVHDLTHHRSDVAAPSRSARRGRVAAHRAGHASRPRDALVDDVTLSAPVAPDVGRAGRQGCAAGVRPGG